MLKIICERRGKAGGASFKALFRAEMSNVDVEALPKVSLARRPDHCYFRIDKMHEHDGHAPTFTTEKAVDAYIQRVFNDIKKAIAGKPLEIQVPKPPPAKPISDFTECVAHIESK